MPKGKLCLVLLLLVSARVVGEDARLRHDSNFEYVPLHTDVWKKVDDLLTAGKAADVLKLSPPERSQVAEWDEYRLEIAKSLINDKEPIHAQYLLATIAGKSIGTNQGTQALQLLAEVGRQGQLDESLMEELAFDLDTKLEDPELQSMIAYYRGRMLLRKGYNKWAQQSLNEIGAQTTWSREVAYDKAIQTLAKGDSTAAFEQFDAVAKSERTRRPTAMMAQLAMARLMFERKDYAAAIAIYHRLDLPVREQARALNEVAWNYYYSHAYGKALGAIAALRSKYFTKLYTPETAVLEMLIYRELCHYKQVQALAGKYTQAFSALTKPIMARQRLDSISALEQMALQEGVMQKRARIIQDLREERLRLMASKDWRAKDLQTWISDQGLRREQIVNAEIRRMLKERLDPIANRFLDFTDQVRFLKYEASLKLLQIKESQTTDYTPPEKDRVKTDTLFWPINEESWLDEIPDYEVLVQSLCRAEVKK